MDNQINIPNEFEHNQNPIVANNGQTSVQNSSSQNNGYPPPFQWNSNNVPHYTPANNNPVYNCGSINNNPVQKTNIPNASNPNFNTNVNRSFNNPNYNVSPYPAGNTVPNNPNFNRNPNYSGNPNYNRNPNFNNAPNFGGNNGFNNPNVNNNPNYGMKPGFNAPGNMGNSNFNTPNNGNPNFGGNPGFNNPNFNRNVHPNQGYVPQYHHGAAYYPVFNKEYYEERQKFIFAKKTAEKKVRSTSNVAGGALLFSFVISNLFSLLFAIPFVSDLYDSGLSGVGIINIIYSIVTVAGAFLIYDIFFKNNAKKLSLANNGVDCFNFKTNFGAPKGALKTFLLIFIGFGGCMIANYVSNLFLVFFEMFGFTSTYTAVEDPENVQDVILMCISTAVIPPLTEEVAMRGFVMSRMRRYGNWFAIITSAFIFGVFHGTMAQIPFAFVCGLFIGYAVIATDSIWTGVIIHAINNGVSCLCSVLIEYFGEETANIFWSIVSFGGLGIGLVCFIIYYNKYKKNKTTATGFQKVVELSKSSVTAPLTDGVSEYQGDAFELTQKQKVGVFFKSPTVIVGTILYILIAFYSMEFMYV